MSVPDQAQARAMRLSLAVGFVMLVIKMGAYLLTGSAAILGDAAESVVHVAAVVFAAYSLWLAAQPADENHRYGHSKIAFFSAGIEGGLIILAAVFIIYESIHRWIEGLTVANLGAGVLLTLSTVVINAWLGWYLIRTGRQQQSLILVANGRHVLTDGWTSLGAIVGLGLMHLTGAAWWDPVCGLIMAGNILVSGYDLLRQSVAGLMDHADPELTRQLDEALARETAARGVTFHALRHRNAGHVHYVDVHFLFPDDITLREAHRITTDIERTVMKCTEQAVHFTTHLECVGDHDELHPGDSLT
ncbi:cation diffusion facilitator family transporter [Brevifollis gellanilyticus]|uniref:Transporter n=1 Tax=Brevifollis gellanilyticus TaxID=748831 RepID=A0A512M4I8_9BACT|nr:cation diffusion facilitator family transporter [Brevifollis gellanilyticus]GEP41649.1 transporter [Brevifollis gellanilyticus]